MGRMTVDFGIDLGTTNSAIAVMKEGKAQIIKNNDGFEYTPSVVWINEKGALFTGKRAKLRTEVDEKDAYAEFKLQMGTPASYHFLKSGRVMTPAELSAEILKSLKQNVFQRENNEDVQAAVITVPAAFEAPQTEATKQAARLAGINLSPIIMEPTAAAMAHAYHSRADNVFWFVYDFGGGTFDAAIVHIKDGKFRLVEHGGDNHLGGKLIDWEIVDKILAPRAAKEYRLKDFTRNNKEVWKKAFAKLKLAAEDAKIELSRSETANINIDVLCQDENGNNIPFDYELTRQELIPLVTPFIKSSINISRHVLAAAKLGPGAIEKVILVGGPTLAPYLREMVADASEGLGIRLDYTLDPLTIVAQGAAYFASTQLLGSSSQQTPTAMTEGEYQLILNYDPVGNDSQPIIGGKVVKSDVSSFAGYSVNFENQSSQLGWRGGKIPLAANGGFSSSLHAEQTGAPNIFKVSLTDAQGRSQIIKPDSFTYTIAVMPSAPPLIHSIGVALANNQVAWFMEKGTTLPARKRLKLHAAKDLQHGSQDVLRIPVIEGDYELADRNAEIGYLDIKAAEIRRDLRSGADIQVIIEIDESRLIKTTAEIDDLDQEFATPLHLDKPIPDIERLQEEFTLEQKRLEDIRSKAQNTGDTHAQQILDERVTGENMVQSISSALAISSGDPDAGDNAQKRLLGLRVALDDAENYLLLPALIVETEKEIEDIRKLLSSVAADYTRRFQIGEREAKTAIQNKNIDMLKHALTNLVNLEGEILRDLPQFWVSYFNYLCDNMEKMRNQQDARALQAEGKRAIDTNNLDKLKVTVKQMLALLPIEEQKKASRGRSGVSL